MPNSNTNKYVNSANDNISFLLKEAKWIHRNVTSESITKCLPIIRRLINHKIFRDITIPNLNKTKSIIKRKHILNLLAVEANCLDWADYRTKLLEGYDNLGSLESKRLNYSGYPNLWFSTIDEANDYAKGKDAKVIAMGVQAVVIPSQPT